MECDISCRMSRTTNDSGVTPSIYRIVNASSTCSGAQREAADYRFDRFHMVHSQSHFEIRVPQQNHLAFATIALSASMPSSSAASTTERISPLTLMMPTISFAAPGTGVHCRQRKDLDHRRQIDGISVRAKQEHQHAADSAVGALASCDARNRAAAGDRPDPVASRRRPSSIQRRLPSRSRCLIAFQSNFFVAEIIGPSIPRNVSGSIR